MTRMIEIGGRLRNTLSNIGKQERGVETQMLTPSEAAESVLNRITSNEGERNWLRRMGSLYSASKGHPQTDAASAVLSYGFAFEHIYFNPDEDQTQQDIERKQKYIKRGLKAVFGIELVEGQSENPSQEFVEHLGRRINAIVEN